MRKLAQYLSVLALMAPVAASAQTSPVMSSTITLGFSQSSVGGIPGTDIDLSTMSLDFDTDIAFSSAFNLGLDIGFSTTEIDVAGLPVDIEADLISFGLEPSYHFGNGAYVGLYYRMGDLDLSIAPLPITFGVDTQSYGIFGGYESGPLWVEAFYGVSDTDPGLPFGIDITDYGLSASYDISPDFEVFGHLAFTDVDLGGADLDLNLFALGAEYDFGNGFAAYGSVGRLGIDGSALGGADLSATQFAIGGSYDLSQMGSFPAVISLEVAQTNLDLGPIPIDPDVTTFRLGLTIPLGPNASTTPRNSSTMVARGDYRSAIAGGLAAIR